MNVSLYVRIDFKTENPLTQEQISQLYIDGLNLNLRNKDNKTVESEIVSYETEDAVTADELSFLEGMLD